MVKASSSSIEYGEVRGPRDQLEAADDGLNMTKGTPMVDVPARPAGDALPKGFKEVLSDHDDGPGDGVDAGQEPGGPHSVMTSAASSISPPTARWRAGKYNTVDMSPQRLFNDYAAVKRLTPAAAR